MRACAVVVGLCLVACGESPQDAVTDDAQFISMEDAPVEELPIEGAPEGWTVVRALVEPMKIWDVSFEVPGVVAEVRVQVGDRVRRGHVLALLETEDRKARLAQARELYRSARRAAPHVSAGSGPPPPGLEDAVRRRLVQVRESAKRTSGDRAAFQRTAKRGGEEAARDLALAIGARRNRVDGASRRARRRASDNSLAKAVVSELRTRVLNLEDAVKKSRIRSPIDGLVIGVNAEVGVQWNTRDLRAAFDIVDPESYVARVTIPARRALRFERNEEVWVELPAHVRTDQRTVPAVVHSVSSMDVPLEEDGITLMWREVGFKLPSRLPTDLIVGDEIRVAFAP
jgi:multidrug efflux pump subunit AcrA (membrane-fusion protein)